jgi:ABC-type branched-subunit amino acid transport system ATPase component
VSILKVTNLSKRFGGLMAISKLSFELGEGTILGLIGPNGAGKTTVFNCLSGFHVPDEGEMVFSGKSLRGHAALSGVPDGARPDLPDRQALSDHIGAGQCDGGCHDTGKIYSKGP